MDQLGIIIMSLIGIMFLSIVGVYSWTYSVSKDTSEQLSKIYGVVNGHLQDTKVHINGHDDFVQTKVCDTIHTTITGDLTEIKKDVKSLLSKA